MSFRRIKKLFPKVIGVTAVEKIVFYGAMLNEIIADAINSAVGVLRSV